MAPTVITDQTCWICIKANWETSKYWQLEAAWHALRRASTLSRKKNIRDECTLRYIEPHHTLHLEFSFRMRFTPTGRIKSIYLSTTLIVWVQFEQRRWCLGYVLVYFWGTCTLFQKSDNRSMRFLAFSVGVLEKQCGCLHCVTGPGS